MLSIAILIALAGTPEREDRWQDYSRTAGVGPIYGATLTNTTPNYWDDGAENILLFRWGDQLETTCTASIAATAYKDSAVICFVQDPDIETIWLGGAGNGGLGDYSCGAGCGYYDDTAGPSEKAGHLSCQQIPAGATKYRMPRLGTMRRSPTYRHGACQGANPGGEGEVPVGGPCDVDGDCGTGQTCNTGVESLGVYIVGMATGGAMQCSIEVTQ